MKITLAAIRQRFSEVSQISTDDFYQLWLKNAWDQGSSSNEAPKTTNLLVLDVREKNERDISYIEDSMWIDSSKDVKLNVEIVKSALTEITNRTSNNASAEKEINVVSYCSIGYRSSDLINHLKQEKLNDILPSNVRVNMFNLDGSLFKWANEGKPIIDANGDPTPFVHPYNAVWGSFLNEKFRKSSL